MNKLTGLFKNRFVKLGLPFVTIVVGGSFFLQQFTQLRYKYNRRIKQLTKEEAEKANYKKDATSLEEHLDKSLKEDLYTDEEWENIRLPREEEGKEKMEFLKNRMKQVKENKLKEVQKLA